MSTRSAALLRKAAEVIETQGWCQRTSVNGKGQVCALGALDAAFLAQQEWRAGDIVNAITNLGRHVGDGTVYRWNDEPDRTATEVVKAMNETADEVEFL